MNGSTRNVYMAQYVHWVASPLALDMLPTSLIGVIKEKVWNYMYLNYSYLYPLILSYSKHYFFSNCFGAPVHWSRGPSILSSCSFPLIIRPLAFSSLAPGCCLHRPWLPLLLFLLTDHVVHGIQSCLMIFWTSESFPFPPTDWTHGAHFPLLLLPLTDHMAPASTPLAPSHWSHSLWCPLLLPTDYMALASYLAPTASCIHSSIHWSYSLTMSCTPAHAYISHSPQSPLLLFPLTDHTALGIISFCSCSLLACYHYLFK